MCKLLVTSLLVTVYFRKFLWWNANTSHNQVNTIQLKRTDFIAICQRNSCWYSQASDVLGLHPPAHSHWNRGWTAGCLSLGMHCAYLLQWSVYKHSASQGTSTLQMILSAVLMTHSDFLSHRVILLQHAVIPLQRMLSASPAGLGERLAFGFGHFEQLHEDRPLLSSFHSCSSGISAPLSFWRVKKLVTYSLLHLSPLDVKGCRDRGLPLLVDKSGPFPSFLLSSPRSCHLHT